MKISEGKWESPLRLVYDYDNFGFWYVFDKVLAEVKTEWQTIRVLSHKVLGNTLIVNEDIMGSENDPSYDDAILELVESPQNVLILGGGDLSLASRLCVYPSVKRITVCEIDPQVPKISGKFIPVGINNKVDIIYKNAFDYIATCPNEFDLIIDDMITNPYMSNDNYYLSLANKFKNKCIISQTDSIRWNVHKEAKASLEGKCEVQQIDRYVLTFLENWTFTKYRLFDIPES